MEKLDRRSEEETYVWIPFRFLDQTLQALLQCLGLLHRDSPTTTKTTSSSVTLNQPEEEEEEDDVEREEVVVTTSGSPNGFVMSTRGIKVKAKKKDKEHHSSGSPGKKN